MSDRDLKFDDIHFWFKATDNGFAFTIDDDTLLLAPEESVKFAEASLVFSTHNGLEGVPSKDLEGSAESMAEVAKLIKQELEIRGKL